MKSRICPLRKHCWDIGLCEQCDVGVAFENMAKKIKRLKSKLAKLEEENEDLKRKIDILRNPNF